MKHLPSLFNVTPTKTYTFAITPGFTPGLLFRTHTHICTNEFIISQRIIGLFRGVFVSMNEFSTDLVS